MTNLIWDRALDGIVREIQLRKISPSSNVAHKSSFIIQSIIQSIESINQSNQLIESINQYVGSFVRLIGFVVESPVLCLDHRHHQTVPVRLLSNKLSWCTLPVLVHDTPNQLHGTGPSHPSFLFQYRPLVATKNSSSARTCRFNSIR